MLVRPIYGFGCWRFPELAMKAQSIRFRLSAAENIQLALTSAFPYAS